MVILPVSKVTFRIDIKIFRFDDKSKEPKISKEIEITAIDNLLFSIWQVEGEKSVTEYTIIHNQTLLVILTIAVSFKHPKSELIFFSKS